MNTDALQMQALITFIMPFFIQLAKRSRRTAFSWIGQNKPLVCLVTSGVAAMATAMGIQIAYAAHSITVTWPDGNAALRGLLTFLVSAGVQFAAQHTLYDGFWRVVLPAGSAPRSAVSAPPLRAGSVQRSAFSAPPLPAAIEASRGAINSSGQG